MYKIPSLSKYWHSILYAELQNSSVVQYRECRTDENIFFFLTEVTFSMTSAFCNFGHVKILIGFLCLHIFISKKYPRDFS